MKSMYLLLLLAFVVTIEAQKQYLNPQFTWRYLDFEFPTTAVRNSAISSGLYKKQNPFPLDIDVYNGGLFAVSFFFLCSKENRKTKIDFSKRTDIFRDDTKIFRWNAIDTEHNIGLCQ